MFLVVSHDSIRGFVRPSVEPSVGPSVGPLVCLLVGNDFVLMGKDEPANNYFCVAERQ